MKTRLLAEMIYSAVVYGQGTKRQIIDKIASMLEADRTARMEAAEAIETLAHAAMSGYAMTPARVSELVELVRNSYKLPPEPRTCETCATKCSYPYAEPGCPFHVARSPQSVDVDTVREEETSYCIERVGANLYWGGSPMTGRYKGLDALVSIGTAIRFSRKEDAEMVRARQGMDPDEYVVTEHRWQ